MGNLEEIVPAPRSSPVKARTVFVSSRLDEVAIERRAAFEAIYGARLVPLLYEMEPLEDTKAKIDALVDRADLFVGIYSHTIGAANADLFELRPIEYELIRFLAGFDKGLRVADRNKLHLSKERNKLNEALKSKAYHAELMCKAREQARLHEGPIFDLFSRRIRLYVREDTGDWPVSAQLYRFIEGLPKCRFRTEMRESPDGGAEKKLSVTSYIPPHGSLFALVLAELEKTFDPNGGALSRWKDGKSAVVSIRVSGRDMPGILHAVFKECFEEWINVFAVRVSRNNEHTFTTIVGRVFEENIESEQDRLDLLDRLVRNLRDRLPSELTVDRLEAVDGASSEDSVRPDAKWHFFLVEGANVPGLLMNVSALVSSHGGTIRYLDFDTSLQSGASSDGGQVHPFGVFGLEPVALSAAVATSTGRAALIYQMKSLVGVTIAKEIPWKEARRLQRKHQPGGKVRRRSPIRRPQKPE